jgi:hypothetical protein
MSIHDRDETFAPVVEPGMLDVMVGSSSEDIRLILNLILTSPSPRQQGLHRKPLPLSETGNSPPFVIMRR